MRLSWEDAEDPDAARERRRALPAGSYTLVGYRLVADDANGKRWHVSATGASIREITVASGVDQRVEIDESIRIASGVHAGRIQVAIRGEHGAGLSIYADGRRIPIDYRLRDASGAELARGPIEYG